MDPRTKFYNQHELFVKEFPYSQNWAIRKDVKNNIIILIPPEWFLHSQYNGVSFQFALNVRGELALSVSVENPIVLESRVEFKGDLYKILNAKGLLETAFRGFEPNFNQRGKFLKKTLPLLIG